MKILVTGGAGFIGSHITDLFIQEGHEVIIIDNLSHGTKKNINPKAKFFEANICDRQIADIIKENQPEVLCHQAAQISLNYSNKHPKQDAVTNIIGLINVIEIMRQYTKLKKIIFASSGGAIYGSKNKLPNNEKQQPLPESPYAISKLSGELYLNFYNRYFSIPSVILRYANVYGPRQLPIGEAGVIAIFCNDLINDKTPTINGTGTQTRDFVFVKDVALANLAALKSQNSGYFNISTGKQTSINRIYNLINQYSKAHLKPKYGPKIKGEQKKSCLSNQLAKEQLKWKPQTCLESGIKQTVKYFSRNNN